MAKQEEALKWIIGILRKHNIPFLAVGGLAAKAYGSKRELVDIDLAMPEKDFFKILEDIKEYHIGGPGRNKEGQWDCEDIEINYKGQIIELGGSDKTKIFNKKSGKWEKFKVNFSKLVIKNVLGMNVPIMPKEDLITYKKILNRKVDRLDLSQIS